MNFDHGGDDEFIDYCNYMVAKKRWPMKRVEASAFADTSEDSVRTGFAISFFLLIIGVWVHKRRVRAPT